MNKQIDEMNTTGMRTAMLPKWCAIAFGSERPMIPTPLTTRSTFNAAEYVRGLSNCETAKEAR